MSADRLARYFADPRREPATTAGEWELVLGQARQTALIGRLARQLADSGMLDAVPERPRRHLQSALRVVERQQREVCWEVDCIRRALENVDTPIVLLKGAAYLISRLPPAPGRLFSDVDIMVARDQLPAVEAALFSAGWLSEARDPYTNRYYREWMHELPPMRHVQRGTTIDVHHTIAPPTSQFAVDGSRLLERIAPIAGQPRLYTLSPADLVLHSATHLFQEGELWHGLRDLLDLNDLVVAGSRSPVFWDELLDRAAELGLGIPLSHALVHLCRLFGTRPPIHLLPRVNMLDKSVLSRHLMSWLLGIALRPEHPSCNGPFTDLARFLLYVRSHYLRMPLHRVVPHLVRKTYMRVEGKPVA